MYFVIRKNKDGKYWWRAVGDNNEIMAASQLMDSKQSCKDAIATVKAEAAAAAVHDKTDEIKELSFPRFPGLFGLGDHAAGSAGV